MRDINLQVRLNEKEADTLLKICLLYGMERAEMIRYLIRMEARRMFGDE